MHESVFSFWQLRWVWIFCYALANAITTNLWEQLDTHKKTLENGVRLLPRAWLQNTPRDSMQQAIFKYKEEQHHDNATSASIVVHRSCVLSLQMRVSSLVIALGSLWPGCAYTYLCLGGKGLCCLKVWEHSESYLHWHSGAEPLPDPAVCSVSPACVQFQGPRSDQCHLFITHWLTPSKEDSWTIFTPFQYQTLRRAFPSHASSLYARLPWRLVATYLRIPHHHTDSMLAALQIGWFSLTDLWPPWSREHKQCHTCYLRVMRMVCLCAV